MLIKFIEKSSNNLLFIFYKGGFIMQPIKFFNFTMPFDMYSELQTISRQAELPIAVLVRSGIRHVLKDSKIRQIKREDELAEEI